MATNINTILSWFKTGLKPTQAQFWASWSSFWHKDEVIPQSSISELENVLNAKAEKGQFDAHKTDVNAHAELFALKEDKGNKGNAGGYAPLNEFSKIAVQYLDIVDNLTSGGNANLLSAEQGKVLKGQIDAVNVLLASDDVNLDTFREMVDAIKGVQTELHTILVNDLTTGGVTKALTAEQGKVLKGLVDAVKVIDESNLLHKAGDEVKAGTLQVDKIITKNGTSNQYVKGDGTLGNIDSLGSGGSIDFANLTHTQAIQIFTAINNVYKYWLEKYIGDFRDLAIPLLINGTEKSDHFFTYGAFEKFYITSKPPITVRFREDFAPVLGPGECVLIYARVNSSFTLSLWYKSVPAGTFVGFYENNLPEEFVIDEQNLPKDISLKNNSIRIGITKRTDYNELIEVTNPINFEIENTVTDFPCLPNPIIVIRSAGKGEVSNAVNGTIISIKPYKKYSGIRIIYYKNIYQKEIKFELIDKGTNEVIESNIINKYEDSDFIRVRLEYDFYVNKNFKIKISNI